MTSKNLTWNDCTTITQTFSTIDGHDIKCDVIFPPNLEPGKHPLIIAYHGGYLISGSRNHYPFMAAWLPEYAASVSALIVSPDYRLFPSATSKEVREDVESLWVWVHKSLSSLLALKTPDHQVDLDRVLVEGNSAGGFCAAHLAMDHPNEIRAAVLVYPMLFNLSDYLANGPPNGAELTTKRNLWIGPELQDKIEEQKRLGWISERRSPEHLKLTVSIMKRGQFGQLFGQKRHDPIYRVRHRDCVGLPSKTWILHGKDDSGVPVDGSVEFTREVGNCGWNSDVFLDIIDNEPSEHGFDRNWTMSNEKLIRGLKWINEAWLDTDD